MEREYIQVRPSREKINAEDIVSHISSLHKLTSRKNKQSVRLRLSPLQDSSEEIPKFELLAVSQGKDSPVEFFYGTEPEHLNSLKNRLTTAYPASFDVEVVSVDVLQKIIPPERYAPDDFVKKMDNGHLLFDPDAVGTQTDIEEGNTETTTDTDSDESTESMTDSPTGSNASSKNNSGSDGDMFSLDVERASETTQPREEDAKTSDGDEKKLSPEQIDGYDMLKEIDAGLLDLVELPDEVDGDYLEQHVEGPTWTDDGDILARPTLEHGEPIAARWEGSGERKKDWMTTMKMFSKITNSNGGQGNDDIQDRAPLATLIQHLASSDLPIAFQVVFKRIEDWSRQGERRKDNLHLNRDTLGQKIMYELGEILHSPSKERRRERMRDHMEGIGESADSNAESPIAGDVGKRRKLIDNKIPKRTFRANMRAISVANNEVPVEDVERTMEDLTSVLDHLDGYFYGLEPMVLRDNEGGYRSKQEATEEFHRFVNRDIVSGSGKRRPDVVVNADELANFITVPSSKDLTVEGVRGTRAEPEARDPLAKPDPDLMRQFHQPGMRIGYALDKENETEPVPTQVPPSMLTKHYGRFATTGAGKSKALINDILSLHENTDGPTILLDPKGDGMTENYMKAHFERFGEENFKEKVIHFPIPDILPGFSFFNIEQELERRKHESNLPQQKLRNDVVQNKADYYQELLKLVMGVESYGESKVAPILISSFIKVLYDEEYVNERQLEGSNDGEDNHADVLNDRPSNNYFTHEQLEQLSRQIHKGNVPDPVSYENQTIRDTIQEQVEGDEHTFSVIMNSVFNRLNYIREDQHLRQIFNNTEPAFDFRDHLNDDKVILFDLGGLRDEASLVISGLILTELWSSIQTSQQTKCTQGHESDEKCRERAKANGLDPSNPPCHEEWPDDHIVNLIMDEAASVTVSSIVSKMLEQGRSFNLSLGLSMQFPEQMKDSSERVYKNVLNNVATKLIGKITLDEEIAKAMAHEGMDVTEFNNRIKALPRGEWVAQLPSPTFMETGPEPFSLEPLPIPAGHPESKNVLTEEADQRFDYFLENQIHRRTRQEYGIDIDETTNKPQSPNQRATNVDTSHLEDDDSSTSGTSGDSDDDSAYDDTEMGDVAVPDGVIDASGQDSNSMNSSPSNDASTSSKNTTQNDIDTPTDSTDTGNSLGIGDVERDEETLPSHINWHSDTEVYSCAICHSEYFPAERKDAVGCCQQTLTELQKDLGDPTAIEPVSNTQGYVTSAEKVKYHDGEIAALATTVKTNNAKFDEGNEPTLNDITIKRPNDIREAIGEYNAVTIGSIASALTASTPPEYQPELETVMDYFLKILQEHNDELSEQVNPTPAGLRELIYHTPPADINIDIRQVIESVLDNGKEIDEPTFTLWERNDCDPLFKRFYSGRTVIPTPKQEKEMFTQKLARPATYGTTYNTNVGLSDAVSDDHRSPKAYGLPDKDTTTSSGTTTDDDIETTVPLKKVGSPGITQSHLEEYDITEDEARFMRAVVKGMNRDLEGYNLTDSMSGIKNHYEFNEQKLMDAGYIKKHTGVRNRIYYTVTSDGQNACGITKKHGIEVGDLGADTPHRVGIELAREYYNGMPNVRRVELSTKEDGNETDLAVVDNNGNRIAIIEVEAGRVSKDSSTKDGQDSGIHNYESVRKDYGLLKESDGEAVWVVRNNEVAASVLRALNSADNDDVPFELSKDVLDGVKSGDINIETLNENYLADMGDDGVNRVLTYMQLRNKINSRNTDE